MFNMKYILLFLLFFILNNILFSQKEGNNWYFGTNAGLNFTTNPNICWDGKYKGELVPQGVYSYIINFTDSQDFNRHTLQGEITVIY